MKKAMHPLALAMIFFLGCHKENDPQATHEEQVYEQITETVSSMDSLSFIMFIDPETELSSEGYNLTPKGVRRFKRNKEFGILLSCNAEPDSLHISMEKDDSSLYYLPDYPYGRYSIPNAIIDSVSTMVHYVIHDLSGFIPMPIYFYVPTAIYAPEDNHVEIESILAIWLNEETDGFMNVSLTSE
jgi:hypothetical protein